MKATDLARNLLVVLIVLLLGAIFLNIHNSDTLIIQIGSTLDAQSSIHDQLRSGVRLR